MGGIILFSLLGLGLTSLIFPDDDEDREDANNQITDDDQVTFGPEDNFIFEENNRAFLEDNDLFTDENIDNAVSLDGALNVGAGAGDDQVYGSELNDTISVGAGDDFVSGWSRDDAISGGRQNDEIYGDDGNDVLTLGQNDIAFGGNGSDTFQLGQWITTDNQAEIRDFDPTDDKIEVVYDQDLEDEPIVTIETSRVTDDALILIDGVVVANVIGAKNLISASDVLISQEQFG